MKFASIMLLLLVSNIAVSQVNISHKSDWFYIENNEDVFIRGNIVSLDSNNKPIVNLGEMYITDTITCFGTNKIFGATPDTVMGNVYLVGDKPQYFTGDKNIRFGNVFINNTYDSLFLLNNVDVYNKLQLTAGNVYIPDFTTLDFLFTGNLRGETNSKRIFGSNYSVMQADRPLINGNTYTNIAGFGLDLSINGNLGINTKVWRKNVQQLNVSNGSIDRFYFFEPENNAFVSSPNIYYLDTIELHNNNEDSLSLYLSETLGNTWVEKGGIVDNTSDKVSTDAGLSFVLSDETMISLAEADCQNPPYLKFMEDTIPLCDNAPAWLFAEGVSGMSSVWSNGSLNNDSILVSQPGTYELTITDIKGCPSTDSVVVISAPNPVTNFSVEPACVGNVTDFVNLTTIPSGNSTYAWDLADVYSNLEDTSSLENPSITYTNQGSYNVSLIATSNYGCQTSKTKLALVNPYPIIDFNIVNNCADSTLSFTNGTLVLPSETITYFWDFGNGDSSISTIPTYSFDTAGVYTVELAATSLSCTSTSIQNITINPNPIANFTSNNACLNNISIFTNTTSIATGTTTHSWLFEAGNNSTLSDPTYTYSAAGNFPVKLTSTSDQGCIHDTTILVTVNSLPTPIFMANASCQESVMTFVNNSESSSTFNWDFNGIAQSTDYAPTHTFISSGSKVIVLEETDTNGCIASTNQNIDSKPKPYTDFITVNGCEDESINFANTSSTPSGTITYRWVFGDTYESTLSSPTHAFASSANYDVKLITENNGCFDSIIKTTTIHPKPILDFGGSIATCSDSLVLDAQNPGSTYLWSNLSTQQHLDVVYNGTYWVEITSDQNCTHSDTVIATLNSVVSPAIGEDSMFCDSTMLNAGYYGSSFLWSTGATTQSISVNSNATIWVQVTDANNCVGSDTIIAGIANSVIPDLGTDLAPCDGEITSINSGQTGFTYLWSTGETTDTINVNNTNSYWVELTDNNNCVSRDTIIVSYKPNPILSLGIDTNYCDTAYYDISQNNTTYLWEDGSTLANRNISNNGTYWAAITDITSGCITKDTVSITTSITPIVYLGEDSTLCNGEQILLDAIYPMYQYQWNIGDTTQTITAAASGFYSVDVKSPQGCIGNDSIEITISNPLDPNLGQDFVLCTNNIAEISSPIDFANYQWIFNDSLLSETSQMISISEPGELISLVTTNNNCFATDTLELLLTSSEIHAEFLVATEGVYVDDTIQFINLSNPNPYTSVWDFGDGVYSIQENPSHIYVQDGEYYTILEANNGICTDTVMKKITVEPASKKRLKESLTNKILDFNLYPNPNDGNFKLEVKLVKRTKIIVECFDIYGRMIQTQTSEAEKLTVDYNMMNISTGMYFLRISIDGHTENIKFIKN